ncbi:hypothetical protein [Cytobacillus gottheilii]|uniref:Uncharacterized protein n=1 Tax=Cytobacillus gottheilii TaxID=859144 RepID=A0ABX8FCR1_9BACI|nr:hypothetical protein [Cytobacillus gottheilii]QVY61312.1 hypothetical protein J1899_20590 [Cytobacillus gottheilii]
MSVPAYGGAAEINAAFDEKVNGFRLQYVSPDGAKNDIHITDLATGKGIYTWVNPGDTKENTTSLFSRTFDDHYQAYNYSFMRNDGTFYELRLKAGIDNSISIVFLNPGLDADDVYANQVRFLLSQTTSHLFVTDAAGNVSADLLLIGE